MNGFTCIADEELEALKRHIDELTEALERTNETTVPRWQHDEVVEALRKRVTELTTERDSLEKTIENIWAGDSGAECTVCERLTANGTCTECRRGTSPLMVTRNEAKRLRDALAATLAVYVRLANSGDAGFWDPEKESHIIAARAALAPFHPTPHDGSPEVVTP